MKKKVLAIYLVMLVLVLTVSAQTTEFTYQGSLRDGSATANGTYDFEFRLFDSPFGGAPLGTNARSGVAVTNGIFSVNLDFGSPFNGADRYIEIGVRLAGGGGFTTLSPRQKVGSAPYSIKSISSETSNSANSAATATNATTAVNLSGPLAGDVTGTQSATSVTRLQGRNLAATLPSDGQVLKYNSGNNQWQPDTDSTGAGGGGGTITGVTAGTGLTGGGTSGTVSVAIANGGVGSNELALNAVTTAKIADSNITDVKIATVSGSKITGSITTATIPGASVTGTVANATNATTATNFTGTLAGNVTGTQGATVIANNAVTTSKLADSSVTATKIASGQIVKGVNGITDSVTLAAGSNVTITPSGNTLTIASTGGGNAILNQTGQQAGANFNISGTGTANIFNALTRFDLGGSRILSSPETSLLFLGRLSGQSNTSGTANYFFGGGSSNTEGSQNVFLGGGAGNGNTTGGQNTFAGVSTGIGNKTGSRNSYFGGFAGWVGDSNDNTMMGYHAGFSTTGSGNTFIGTSAGDANTTGSSNTAIGSNSDFSGNLTFATAIGANATASLSNSIYLGRSGGQDAVRIPGPVLIDGSLVIGTLGSGNTNNQLCLNSASRVSSCMPSSSLRYKDNINRFSSGMALVQRLKPITFDWKEDGMHDLGLGAEDVEAVEPLLVHYNKQGQVEGVKYDRIGVVLINAVKEQQAQIDMQNKQIAVQKTEIEELRTLVCLKNRRAKICQTNR